MAKAEIRYVGDIGIAQNRRAQPIVIASARSFVMSTGGASGSGHSRAFGREPGAARVSLCADPLRCALWTAARPFCPPLSLRRPGVNRWPGRATMNHQQAHWWEAFGLAPLARGADHYPRPSPLGGEGSRAVAFDPREQG